jgi:hypothetical protein
MGFSYSVNPRTGRQLLCCDYCGSTGARKHRCPYGYCPSTAMCPSCLSKHGNGKDKHPNCDQLHREYVAQQAERAANPAGFVGCAYGKWCTGTDDVLVCACDQESYYLVPATIYEQRSTHNIPITSDYRPIESFAAQALIKGAYERS